MQKISISPEIWARVRRRAFDTATTASKLTEVALAEYLDREDKPRAGAATKSLAPLLEATRPITDAKIHEVSVTSKKMPWDDAKTVPLLDPHDTPIGRVTSVNEVSGGIEVEAVVFGTSKPDGSIAPPAVVIEDGEYKLTPEAMAAKAAALAAQKGREFTPVPKPASTKKPSTRARR